MKKKGKIKKKPYGVPTCIGVHDFTICRGREFKYTV